MGTWGKGNFENDSALDWIGDALSDPVIAEIEQDLNDHDESTGEIIMAVVETLAVLCEHLPVHSPAPNVVEKWRTDYLASWHQYIDELSPKPGHKEARLKVIESTFHRLAAIARKMAR